MEDKKLSVRRVIFVVLLISHFVPGLVFAQAPFYQGKTIKLIRGSSPGGVGEMRMRAMTPYLSKYIPGNPTIVMEFMPGGGGRTAGNYMFHRARPDGLTIGNIGSGLITSGALGETGVEYKLDNFIYLGTPYTGTHYIFITNKSLGLSTLEKLRAHSGLRIAAHAVGHEIYLTGRMFAYLMGLKEPRFVTGFSSPEMDIAMMQGEVDARSQTQESIELTPELIEKGLVDFHAIIENPKAKKNPRFSSLPDLDSFGRSPREKSVLTMHRTFRLVGTPTILPPGTPKDRVDILREAMRQIFKDPAFARDF